MKKIKLLLFLSVALSLFSCNEPAPIQTSLEKLKELVAEPSINNDSITAFIDETRNAIESNLEDPTIVYTSELKGKIKQKWAKMHFYVSEGQVVRVKTYAYESISTRTEEFYLQNGALVLAVVEDDGSGDRGKDDEAIDKMYYFHNGEVIKEKHAENEKEYGVRGSDGEELLGELAEYLDIFSNQDLK
jgi:co-chaperonin GroES (HSP10)